MKTYLIFVLRSFKDNFMSVKNFLYQVQKNIEDDKNLELKGEFYERKNILDLKILVCLDVSGSISQETFSSFMKTVDLIKGVSVIKILETDTAVTALYNYSGSQKIARLAGSGGTDFYEAFELAKELKPSAILFMTDGVVFDSVVEDPGIPTGWILSADSPLSETPPYGFGQIVQKLLPNQD